MIEEYTIIIDSEHNMENDLDEALREMMAGAIGPATVTVIDPRGHKSQFVAEDTKDIRRRAGIEPYLTRKDLLKGSK